MKPEIREIPLSDIRFVEGLYPRKAHDPSLVQRYAATLDEIEARGNYISVGADLVLLDGRHRHLAYLKNTNGTPRMVHVFFYDVSDEAEQYALAVELNSSHGSQLSPDDKRVCILNLYSRFNFPLDRIAKLASVRKATVLDVTKSFREEEEKQINARIFESWLSCHSIEEIAKNIGITKPTVIEKIEFGKKTFLGTKSTKLVKYDDDEFQSPIYNVWTFAKKTNDVEHFGNSEQRIVDNLLYLYTEPFDIVLDPFAGGGSTIDVCKRRMRRYWVSDRKPIVERENEIRTLDVAAALPPLNKRWSEVALTYLDPPYWKQAEGKYSKDAEDLANMPLDKFTKTLAGIVNRIAAKQSRGVIALLIQPTQWKSDKKVFTDHVIDVINGASRKRLILENRVSCPYSTEQYNPQQVEWAKANKKLLVLSRELIIWRVANRA